LQKRFLNILRLSAEVCCGLADGAPVTNPDLEHHFHGTGRLSDLPFTSSSSTPTLSETNQAIFVCPRVVIVTVALIVLLSKEQLFADRLDSLALTEIRQLQNQLTAASTGLAQFWIR
jgi:hypothetical protein